MQGALLLDVVVRQGTPVLQLLAGEDQALLVRGDACAVAPIRASGQRGLGMLLRHGYLVFQHSVRTGVQPAARHWPQRSMAAGEPTSHNVEDKSCLKGIGPLGLVFSPSLSWIFAFTFSIVSELSTSRVMVLPGQVAMQQRRRTCKDTW